MYLAYKKDDIYVKIVACLFISCFIVMCFIGKVFASDDIVVKIDNIDYSIDLQRFKNKINNGSNYNYFAIFRYTNNDYVSVWLYDRNVDLLINNDWQCHLRTNSSEVTHFVEFTYYFKTSRIDTGEHYYNITNSSGDYWFGSGFSNSWSVISSNSKVYINSFNDNNLIFNPIQFPVITTSLEDLQTLNFDTISVSAFDWSNKDLYILFYDRSLMNNEDTQGLYPKKEIKLTKDSSYYIPEISSEENAIYWIANDNTGLNFKVGGKYEIRLAERVPESTGRWLSWR